MCESSDQKFKKATLDVLVQKSYDAATRAHVPYSKFPGNYYVEYYGFFFKKKKLKFSANIVHNV